MDVEFGGVDGESLGVEEDELKNLMKSLRTDSRDFPILSGVIFDTSNSHQNNDQISSYLRRN